MKTIAASILLGLALIVLAFVVFMVAAIIFDNLRIRSSEPVRIHPIFFVPDFMGLGSFITTGRAFLTGSIGLGLLLLASSMHLKWMARNTATQTNKGIAEHAVAPNRSLPSSQKSTSPVRGSED